MAPAEHLAAGISVIRGKKGGARKAPPPAPGVLVSFYEALRRRRPSRPNPTSALPRSVSEAGSGAGVGNFSPLDIRAVSEPVVLDNASMVRPPETGIVIKSRRSVAPT